MSSALKRRFNTIVLPAPANLDTDVTIVTKRVAEISNNYCLKATLPPHEIVEKIVAIFHKLRQGMILGKKQKLKSLTGVISTAKTDLAVDLQDTVVKGEDKDKLVWKECLENVMKNATQIGAGYTICAVQSTNKGSGYFC